MKKRVAILISGGGSNMVALANSMVEDHPARPVLVLSNRPGAGGLEKARDLGIATSAIDHKPFGRDRAGFEAALHARLLEARPDIIALAGFMRVLSADFVNRWPEKILNIHPSLLPKYKGLDTHARAIAAGDAVGGCSVHIVTPALDGGPILGQARVPIRAGDSAQDLAARVLVREHRLYPAVLARFATGTRARLDLPFAP